MASLHCAGGRQPAAERLVGLTTLLPNPRMLCISSFCCCALPAAVLCHFSTLPTSGVGHMAVQLAKSLGLYVVGVAGASNASWVKQELGADEVVDYSKQVSGWCCQHGRRLSLEREDRERGAACRVQAACE